MAEKIGTDEKEIKKYLTGLDDECDGYKETVISKEWGSIPDFYSGRNHWGQYRPKHKMSPVLNFLRQAIERKTSLMTDTKPFIDILPYRDELQDVSEALQEIVISKWSEQSLDMTLTDVIFYAELFGTCGVNTLLDKSLHHGEGDITMHCIDPRNLNFDPMVTAPQYLNQSEYVRIEQIQPTSLLKYLYGNDEIKSDAPVTFLGGKRGKGPRGKVIRKVVSMLKKKSAIDRSLVREYWLQDRELVHKKLKYPGGRHIIIAGGQIVVDEKNPYWDAEHPIDIIDWHRNPDSAWGDGEIVDLKELQLLLNKLIALIVENGLLMTNSIWVGDSDALSPEQWEELDNVPGLKVKKKPRSELRREPPPPLSQSLFSTVAYLESAIEKLSGNTEVVRGGTPGQVKSGIAIEALQTAAMAIIRLKSRTIESLLERVGQKMISRIFQFESSKRLMWRMKNGQDYEKFEFFREKIIKDKKMFKNPREAFKDFLFKIRPGSSLAMNNWQKSMIALQMYQAQPKPLIDRLGVLETMDWPGRTDIIQRLEIEEAAELEKMMALEQNSLSGNAGGSAPKVSDIRSPHAVQGIQEGMSKNI